jgi:hypothetical protein
MGAFNTDECAFHQTSLMFLGRKIVGIRAFSFKKGVDKEHLYGAGDEPIDITTGNKKPEGSITVIKYEFDKMCEAAQLAGYDDITDVPHDALIISCVFKRSKTSPTMEMLVNAPSFLEYEVGMQQGAKNTDVALPFLAMKVTNRRK